MKVFAHRPRAAPGRGLRARVLERHRPRGPLPARRRRALRRRRHGAHLRGRLQGVREAQGPRRRRRDRPHGRHAPRHEGDLQREMDTLESHLSFLATVGSVSPYIGLFGTVWGIMNAFRGLSNVAQATLAQVAPGIAEALVATAIGLFAAIPAVIAYNRYSHDIDRLAGPLRELHGGVLQHPAAPGAPAGAIDAPAPPRDERDQRRALHRRDAGAARHLHGDRPAHQSRADRPAAGGRQARPGGGAAGGARARQRRARRRGPLALARTSCS